jgi:hypothetical protein
MKASGERSARQEQARAHAAAEQRADELCDGSAVSDALAKSVRMRPAALRRAEGSPNKKMLAR